MKFKFVYVCVRIQAEILQVISSLSKETPRFVAVVFDFERVLLGKPVPTERCPCRGNR